MPKITLAEALPSKLHELSQMVELCDPSGRVLGRFILLIDLSEWEPISPDVSEEELDRRERSNEKRYTTEEVLAYLEKRCFASSGSSRHWTNSRTYGHKRTRYSDRPSPRQATFWTSA